QDAWSALRAVQASVPAGDHAFWQTYADLAWECGAQEEALARACHWTMVKALRAP
ncbi:MAG: hypothetical protein RLZZ573_1971, partial [Pseudomonadota bacterium]